MEYILKNAQIYTESGFRKQDILVSDGRVLCICNRLCAEYTKSIDLTDKHIFPGFVDVHVHLREPGFSYKETVKSGSLAAAVSGYTAICSMPNVSPVPDSIDGLNRQLEIIKKDAAVNMLPYGSITVGRKGEKLSDMTALSEKVVAFSDDGSGIQTEEMMREAMLTAKKLGKIIAAHCEDNSLLNGGYIHNGVYAKSHGHKGISSESEWKQIERDLRLAEETGCKYHVCHISTKESVDIIRKAKCRGVDVTCETAPHYLVLTDEDIREDGRFKMNPPLRAAADREALLEGLCDGTIDMIATDHAPHSEEEKSKGLRDSAMGIVGLETAFPVLYTKLVKGGIISLKKLVELMSINPAARFGIKTGFAIKELADFTVYDLNQKYTVDPNEFKTMGRSTPFEGDTVFGKCMMNVCNGKTVWEAE